MPFSGASAIRQRCALHCCARPLCVPAAHTSCIRQVSTCVLRSGCTLSWHGPSVSDAKARLAKSGCSRQVHLAARHGVPPFQRHVRQLVLPDFDERTGKQDPLRSIVRLLCTSCSRAVAQEGAASQPLFKVQVISPPPYKVLFCGTDEFSCVIFEELLRHRQDLIQHVEVLVPSSPEPRKSSRGKQRVAIPPLKLLAAEHDITIHEVPRAGLDSFEVPDSFRESSNALLVAASFGHLIPPAFLHAFPHWQKLNVHPSLLPKLRGAAPIQWAIARGHTLTGVSVQRISEKFDHGELLNSQEAMPTSSSYIRLRDQLAAIGAALLAETLRTLPERAAKACPQSAMPDSHQPPSMARKVQRRHALVDWNTMSAERIERLNRGVSHFFPVYSMMPNPKATDPRSSINEVSLHDLEVVELGGVSELSAADSKAMSLLRDADSMPGTACLSRPLGGLLMKCVGEGKDASFLLARKLHTAGKPKPAKDAEEWLIGYKERLDQRGLLTFTSALEKS
ncbi:Formyltransferase [Ceraceosorus guamensis]|uniref:methionyl-tRNA formyltransferase n=1 Tax=Ceraceosorus guamensis TaxID=1522189 RepID=A0A316VV19_9BASI|nr:Formyltransferase [Ceraceosorus guamensis]PWN41310.1 Formyltransferase [Ceraceosorus guamensis]